MSANRKDNIYKLTVGGLLLAVGIIIQLILVPLIVFALYKTEEKHSN